MRKYFYFMIVLILSGGTFSSCLDNEEPKGIENLRGAMSELYKAKAQVELAEAELKKADLAMKAAMVEHQNILNKQAEVQIDIAKADLENKKILNEREQLENKRQENANELEKLQEEAKFDHAKAMQALQLKAEQAKIDKQLSDLEVTQKENEKLIAEKENAMKEAAETHKKNMVELQTQLAQAEQAYKDALELIEAQKTMLTTEQQLLIAPVLAKLDEINRDIKLNQGKLLTAERALIDLNVNFDPESYEKGLALTVTAKELELANAQKAKDQIAIFNTKPFSEWEKQLLAMEDTLAKVKVEQDLTTTRIAQIELEKQPFENRIGEINLTIQKKTAEYQEQYRELQQINTKYNENKEFNIPVPHSSIENTAFTALLYYNPYANYILRDPYTNQVLYATQDPVTYKWSLDDHMIHFNAGSLTMNELLVGGEYWDYNYNQYRLYGGIALVFKNKLISDEEKAQQQLLLNDRKNDKDVLTKEYTEAKTEWEKTVKAYEEAEKAYGFGEKKDLQAITREAWEKYSNITTDKRTKTDTIDLLKAVETYLTKRTALNGSLGITVLEPVSSEYKPLEEFLTYDNYKKHPNSDINDAIQQAVYTQTVANQGPQGGAYKAWNDASVTLFGTRRHTELALTEFDGRLILEDDGTIMTNVPGLTEILTKLNLDQYTLSYTLWFKKYQAEFLYDNLNLEISQQTHFRQLFENTLALQTEVTASIQSIDDEAQVIKDKMEAITAEITALNEEKEVQQRESQKIDLEKIAPLKNMFDADNNTGVLYNRYQDLDNIRKSILKIMGTNESGDINANWWQNQKAEEIKAIIEYLMSLKEQDIATAEGNLAQAKKALERFNQGGDPQQTAITDKQKEIDDLKAEIEKLQKDFEEQTAKKDHLMEIFLGSEK